ncbi:helix-turn-helix domain-containing protein [Natrialbaceae archaeon A-CW1-1]
MPEDDSDDRDESDISTVLRSLDDSKCREILQSLHEPKSANTLREECGFPKSTMYRKLELLREANLVREYTEIRRDGPNATLYERNFSNISIGIDESDEFTLEIERPEESPEDIFATFFSEMKKEP